MLQNMTNKKIGKKNNNTDFTHNLILNRKMW